MSRSIGFEDITPSPNQMPRQLVLNMETSDSPYARKYREILDKHKRQANGKTDSKNKKRPSIKVREYRRNSRRKANTKPVE
jgi:hypothetical protein